MVFRSCTLIKEEKYYGLLCMVRLQDDGSVHVVHRNHLVATLPSDDSECFAGRGSGFLFRRYEVADPLGQALTTVDFLAIYVNQVCQLKLKPGRGVLCDASCPVTHDQGVDDMVFTCAGRHQKMQGGRYTFAIGCRVFARLTGENTVVFVCAEMHGNEEGHSLFWTADSLRSALREYVKEDLVGQRLRLMFPRCSPVLYEADPVSINDLSLPLHTTILSQLDVESQWRVRRVCTLWSCLQSTENVFKQHILIDVRPHRHVTIANDSLPGEYDTYRDHKIQALLGNSLSPSTRSLTLRADGVDLGERLWMIQAVISAQGLRLPWLLVQNGGGSFLRDPNVSFLSICHGPPNGALQCLNVSEVLTVCEQLVLMDYDVSAALIGSVVNIMHCGHEWEVFDRESGFMRRNWASCSPVVIPRLQFRHTETSADQLRGFLAAVDEQCPAVSREVRKKITAVYARWMKDYPGQWGGMRMFLQLFNCLRADDIPQRWQGMDLRQLQAASLTKVTFAALNACYRR
ncbi:uncharacterized protein LOC129588828 [Paramacrobiotus metropolitanus]|uniref:uncharacterized protein LOC129588828 n=1 Tax=Paramacrobiotus metropolitanus TaxID=2943436 RepID=UPI002445D5E7|nr:uncharacterized protein LOC129588828 [Paramacrobiotus metropolitanus]